jgi:hypothetical protein
MLMGGSFFKPSGSTRPELIKMTLINPGKQVFIR